MKLKPLGKKIKAFVVLASIFTVILTKPYTGVEARKTQKGEGIVASNHLAFSQIEPSLTGTRYGAPVELAILPRATSLPTPKPQVLLAAAKTQAKTIATRVVSEIVKPTPEPSPTPTPVPEPVSAPEYIVDMVNKYSQEYGVDSVAMITIAKCESGFNRNAVGSGIYGGLYQFSITTWISNRVEMGLDPDPELRFNPEEAVRTAAFKMSRDGFGAWPVCGRRV